MPLSPFFTIARIKTPLQLISYCYELKALKHVLSRRLQSHPIDEQVIIAP
jgi:hypothetical protein